MCRAGATLDADRLLTLPLAMTRLAFSAAPGFLGASRSVSSPRRN
jgi:hypothetical protein